VVQAIARLARRQGDTETVILDATADALIVVTGTLEENGTMPGQGKAPTPARSAY
jgi:hypothetical protein